MRCRHCSSESPHTQTWDRRLHLPTSHILSRPPHPPPRSLIKLDVMDGVGEAPGGVVPPCLVPVLKLVAEGIAGAAEAEARQGAEPKPPSDSWEQHMRRC